MSDDRLRQLTSLGEDLCILEDDIRKMEAMLNAKKNQAKQLSEVKIPDIMVDIGMSEFRLTSGYKLKVNPVLAVTLPKDRVDKAEEWLEDNGHAGMVKNVVEVYIPKTADASVRVRLSEYLDSMKLDYQEKKSIHYQTLNAWGRSMDSEGEVIPEDIFNVYRSYATKIEG